MDPEEEQRRQDEQQGQDQQQRQEGPAQGGGDQAAQPLDADRASRTETFGDVAGRSAAAAVDAAGRAGGDFAPSGSGRPAAGGSGQGFNIGGGVWDAVDRAGPLDQTANGVQPRSLGVGGSLGTAGAGALTAGGSSAGGTPLGTGGTLPQGAGGPPSAPRPAGYVDPDQTRDPAAVRAAQQALTRFQQQARENWSQQGFDSQQHYEQALGNAQSGWLNSVTALAHGQLDGGFQGQSWNPGQGWSHDVRGAGAAGRGAAVAAAGPGFSVANAGREGRPLADRDLAGRVAQRAEVAAGRGPVGAAGAAAPAPGAASAAVAPQPLGAAPRPGGLIGAGQRGAQVGAQGAPAVAVNRSPVFAPRVEGPAAGVADSTYGPVDVGRAAEFRPGRGGLIRR